MNFRPFQLADYAACATVDGAILAHDQGLGKGWALIALPLLKVGWDKAPPDGEQRTTNFELVPRAPVLLVAPGDLHPQVTEEAAQWFHVTVRPLAVPSSKFGVQSSALPAAFYLTSYHELARLLPVHPWLAGAFACAVLDEAVKAKGEDTATGLAARSLRSRYRYALSGTPLKNRLADLFPLLHWVAGAVETENAERRTPDEDPEGTPFEVRSSKFPYLAHEAARFCADHLLAERNLTRERAARRAGRRAPAPQLTTRACHHHAFWRITAGLILRRTKAETGETLVGKTRRLVTVGLGTRQRAALQAVLADPARNAAAKLNDLRAGATLGEQD
jgi:SNF2 family DNA or RNA helicase